MKRKCICILTSAHPVDDVRVYRKIALSLVQVFDVIWIGPDTSFFETTTNADGISRELVKPLKGIYGRLCVNYIIIKKFNKLKDKIDCIYFPDPELAFIFIIRNICLRIKTVFDIHEVFHKGLLNRRFKGHLYVLLAWLAKATVKGIVKKVNFTIGVSETVLNYYINPKSNSTVIRSCLPINYGRIDGTLGKKKDVFTVVHGKNHISRGTLQVIEAVKILKDKGIVCKVLMINHSEVEERMMASYSDKYGIGSYFELHNGLPFEKMLYEMSQCHAGIIAYDRNLGIDSLPNRIFEYLALELPAIVPSFGVELAKLVQTEQCGLILDTEDPAQIAGGIIYLMNNPEIRIEMGKRGRNAFLERHNWEAEVEPLINFINQS